MVIIKIGLMASLVMLMQDHYGWQFRQIDNLCVDLMFMQFSSHPSVVTCQQGERTKLSCGCQMANVQYVPMCKAQSFSGWLNGAESFNWFVDRMRMINICIVIFIWIFHHSKRLYSADTAAFEELKKNH